MPYAGAKSSPTWVAAERQQKPLLDTLKTLVEIESGSRDLDGLREIARVIGDRLLRLGMKVDIEASRAPDFHP
ncbi:MAG: hypothetical protein EBX72_12145, partial [Betaproteobacteria bacterium]|nr:hypothetical protein [Betaproteobacteria bacterium]